MKKMALHWKIMVAMALGVIWALVSGYFGWNDFTADWIDPFGTIFINCLKFIAVPLVLFSIITGVAGMGDPSKLGRMGGKTLGLYLVTTIFSITMGLLLVNLFSPGTQSNEEVRLKNRLQYELWAEETGIEVLDGRHELATATPAQIANADKELSASKDTKEYKAATKKREKAEATKSGDGPLQPLIDIVPKNLVVAMSDGRLMLQVIFFALLFGISLAFLPKEKTKTVHSFFVGMNEVFVKMVHIIMRAAPFFVFCLMAGVLAKSADSLDELVGIFVKLLGYSMVVLLGLSVMLFGFYPLFMRMFGVKIGYRKFFQGLSPAQFLAFSTSSSAATLPVTIECVNENLGVPEESTDFVLPIGATVNMDGTSLYQAVAVIFLAQYFDVDLSIMQQLGIVLTATLASIGAAAVPGAGLIMLMIVLESVGLNPMWVAIVLPMDRILDMCRTVINVTSDASVSAIIAKSEKMMD
ncbi:MAG: dicarboxylate/amino acid:cation symporter [Crocinitomicaceae bacterium]|nr:dicarboxylate/amino acid:cation symporter [Flavobacteriales bacterium]NQZ37520.1 dicarboxylate/amino acid:cation symporter [Crocinitomicaceae bacterium]